MTSKAASKTTRAIEPGDQAMDIYTGLKGTVLIRSEWMYGCERLTIQPKGLDDKGGPLDAHVYDDQRIKLVKAGPKRVWGKFAYELGDEVKDKSSGFKGFIESRSRTVADTREYLLAPRKLKEDGQPQDSVWFVEGQLELVKSAKPVITSESASRIGGPQKNERRYSTKVTK